MANDIVIGGVTVTAAGVGAAVLRLAQWWWSQRKPTPPKPSPAKDAADLVNAAAVFQQHLNVAAEGIVAGLRAEIDQMKRDHAREIAELRQSHEACEADGQRLQGELNQQRQITESLARELRKAGIEVTDLTGVRPLIVLEASKS